MSYHIIYSEKRSDKNKRRRLPRTMIGILLLAMLIGFLIHESNIAYHAFPAFRPETRQAFSNMIGLIKKGVPVGEAAVTFGQEIIFGK